MERIVIMEKGLGEVMREIRGKSPLKKVSEHTGVSVSYWSDIERGNRLPTFDVLMKWCTALEIDAEGCDKVAAAFMSTRCSECKHRQAFDEFKSK